MKEILLTRGFSAIVDDEDYDWLNQWKWFYSGGYARRHLPVEQSPTWATVSMHRTIMNPPVENIIDHKNGNPLDNRRENLRVCSQKENSMNASIRSDNATGFKGVHFDKNTCKYRACINVNGKNMKFKRRAFIEEAIQDYREAAVKYFGEFARFV